MDNYLNEFTKVGLSKLMKPFENSPEDVYKMARAFSVAFNLHAGLYRNNNRNDPYINHVLRVALILSEEISFHDIDAIRAALLHDVLEQTRDHSYDASKLLSDFGMDVSNIVVTLSSQTLEGRKVGYPREYFSKIASSPKIIRFIMLADRLENARYMRTISQREKASRYKEETEKYVIPIAQVTDERLAVKLSIALYEIK
jgi:(p)ppGpp synthase/HD superfamily hydrolase